MALPAYFQPNALDFRPVTSAVQNYGQAMERRFDHQTGELVGARLAVNDLAGAQAIAAQRGDLASSVRLRQLGQEDERFQFARELHPLDMQARRVQTQAAQQQIAQAGAMHPLQLAQSRLAIETAQDELDQRRALRNDLAEYGVPSPAVARIPSVARPTSGPPPSPSAVTMPQTAAPPQPRAAAPNVDEFGQRFIQDHILNVPAETGEARFGVLMNDPVFGPAFRTHGYHQMPWRDAATAIAGVTVTPPAAAVPAPAPAAQPPVQLGLVPPLPAQPAAPVAATPPSAEDARQEAIARRMISSGIPQYVTQGRQMLEDINKNRPERIIAREAAQERGKLLGQAQANLPGALRAADSMISRIDTLLDHPSLDSVVGSIQGRLPRSMQSENQAAAQSRIDQILGASFMQAFESLKGGGQITETEGRKATEAIGRLSTQTMGEEEYRKAVEELRAEIHSLTNLARRRAGQPEVPYAPRQVADGARTPANAPRMAPPVRISGDAEYDALPSGARFIGPDGRTRTKP